MSSSPWVSAAPAKPVKKAMPAAATRDPARDTPTADATRMSQRAKGLRMTVKEANPMANTAAAVMTHRVRLSATFSFRMTVRARSSKSGEKDTAVTMTQNCIVFPAAEADMRDALAPSFSGKEGPPNHTPVPCG